MTTDAAAFNPILLDVPDSLDTERLRIRAPRPGDGMIVHSSIVETIDDLRRFPASMIWAMEPQTVDSAEEYCRRGAGNWLLRADFPMLIFRSDSGVHVGNCGVHRLDWQTRVFEIGWWCRKSCQGQGYMTEAIAAVVEFAFRHLGARRVWSSCDDENIKSWRVAERVGFAFEGTLRSERRDLDGTRRNTRVYALTR